MIKKQKHLAKVAKRVMSWHSGYIQHLKLGESGLRRKDFIWHYLLQSFATMGGSKGWIGLIGTTENYDELRYERLQEIKTKSGRLSHVQRICINARVRFPNRKADYICGCFSLIENSGGYQKVKKELLDLKDRDSMIEYLKKFPGISKKYARNLMMDVYHPCFRNSIAVDIRIQSILDSLGLSTKNYKAQEDFLLGVAQLAGLNGWELDRLLYQFSGDFLTELQVCK